MKRNSLINYYLLVALSTIAYGLLEYYKEHTKQPPRRQVKRYIRPEDPYDRRRI